MKFFRPITKFIRGAFFALLLGGCAVGPAYEKPKVNLPGNFGELSANTNGAVSRPVAEATLSQWWKSFHDPELDHLIDGVLNSNYNIQIAATRIREARYQRNIAAASLFPTADADAGYLLGRGSKNVALPLGSTGGAGGSGASAASGKSQTANSPRRQDANSSGQSGASSPTPPLTPFGEGGLPGVTSSLYQVGFDANWELDVFGGNRRQVEAAADQFAAAIEVLNDVKLSLMAEVARDYFELRGIQARLQVARENLDAQSNTVVLTRSRFQSGLATETDVSRASAESDTIAASLPPLESNQRRLIHAISILLARDPTALNSELENSQPLPSLPPEVLVGLPSELLLRRPDIRRAERQIAAANAKIGSAEADLFPKFALTGSLGLDSTSSGSLFDLNSRYFLISPTVVWRVFDAGRIASNIGLQKAAHQEAILRYRSTILTALQEVEDALVAYGTDQQRRAALNNALKENQDTVRLTQNEYEHGLVTYLEVLDARRSLLAVQANLASADETVATDLVALYKALGGGWQ